MVCPDTTTNVSIQCYIDDCCLFYNNYLREVLLHEENPTLHQPPTPPPRPHHISATTPLQARLTPPHRDRPPKNHNATQTRQNPGRGKGRAPAEQPPPSNRANQTHRRNIPPQPKPPDQPKEETPLSKPNVDQEPPTNQTTSTVTPMDIDQDRKRDQGRKSPTEKESRTQPGVNKRLKRSTFTQLATAVAESSTAIHPMETEDDDEHNPSFPQRHTPPDMTQLSPTQLTPLTPIPADVQAEKIQQPATITPAKTNATSHEIPTASQSSSDSSTLNLTHFSQLTAESEDSEPVDKTLLV